jgi:hypothetical protein
MRTTTLWIGLFFLYSLCIAWSSIASAVTIYDESIHGDLPKKPVPFDPDIFPDFLLPEGESKVKGELVAPATPEDTEDWFQFVVPPGTKLPDIEIVIPEPDFGPPISVELYFFDIPTPDDYVWIGAVYGGDPPVKALETPSVAGPPLGDLPPGRYGIRMKTLEDPAYEITFHLVAVPEPTTGLLLILGIGAISLRRRRRFA